MFQAIKDCKDDVELIRNFFEIDGVSVETQDSSGMTVLMHACWKGFEKIVKFLIDQVGHFYYHINADQIYNHTCNQNESLLHLLIDFHLA